MIDSNWSFLCFKLISFLFPHPCHALIIQCSKDISCRQLFQVFVSMDRKRCSQNNTSIAGCRGHHGNPETSTMGQWVGPVRGAPHPAAAEAAPTAGAEDPGSHLTGRDTSLSLSLCIMLLMMGIHTSKWRWQLFSVLLMNSHVMICPLTVGDSLWHTELTCWVLVKDILPKNVSQQ